MGYLRVSPIFRHTHIGLMLNCSLNPTMPSDAKALHGSRSARGDSELSVSPACWDVRASSWATLRHIMLIQPEISERNKPYQTMNESYIIGHLDVVQRF